MDLPIVRVDESAALAGLAGDRELLKDLSVMFCEDAPIVLRDLEIAVESGDALRARRAVHSLKGLVSTFYARSTIELADELEREAADGRLERLRNDGIFQLTQCISSLTEDLKRRHLI